MEWNSQIGNSMFDLMKPIPFLKHSSVKSYDCFYRDTLAIRDHVIYGWNFRGVLIGAPRKISNNSELLKKPVWTRDKISIIIKSSITYFINKILNYKVFYLCVCLILLIIPAVVNSILIPINTYCFFSNHKNQGTHWTYLYQTR